MADLERSFGTLSAFNDDFLTPEQQIIKQIAMFDYGKYLEELSRFPYHEYPLDQMSGVHIDLIEFMTHIHPVRTKSEAEAYLERLEMLEAVFLGTLDLLREQEGLGIFPPEFVFAHLENQISDFLEKPVVDNPLYAVLSYKRSELELPVENRQDYLVRAEEIIDGSASDAIVVFGCRREVFYQSFNCFQSLFRKKVVVILDDDLRSKQCR